MDDALIVGRFESYGDLSRDVDGFLDRKWTGGEAIGQRRPLDQLEDQRAEAVGFLEAVDRRDVAGG